MLNRTLVVLSYVGMALVFGAVVVRGLTWFNVVTPTPEIDRYILYAVLAGLALVIAYTLGQSRQIAEHFRQRNAQYGALAAASVVICLGILIAINYLSERHNTRWDLTENQQYSLSEQTVQLLGGLEAPVRLLVFEQELNQESFRTRLDEYAYHSDFVEVEYIDPDQDPQPAREHEVQVYGTVVMEYMGRTERVTSNSEQDLTNALIKLLNPQAHKVYFLSGHGERSITDTERLGYSAISDALRRDNYEFDTLVLAQTNAIPDDATVVVIAGPESDLLEIETSLLRDYLARGGTLLALVDPPANLTQPVRLPNLTGLLREWGIDVTESFVVDTSGLTANAGVAVAAPPYPAHPIAERLELLTLFPLARAVLPAADAPEGRVASAVVQTSPRSWAETSLATIENPDLLAPDLENGDIAGPVTLGVAVSAPIAAPADASQSDDTDADAADADAGDTADAEDADEPARETRVVALGDSDFAANGNLGTQGNSDFFMNTVSWLAQQENLIAIRPREPSDRRLDLTAPQTRFVFILSLLLVPAAVGGAGVYTWWRRRSR